MLTKCQCILSAKGKQKQENVNSRILGFPPSTFLWLILKVYAYLLETKPRISLENISTITYHTCPVFLMKFPVVVGAYLLNAQQHPEMHGQRTENRIQPYGKNNLSPNSLY